MCKHTDRPPPPQAKPTAQLAPQLPNWFLGSLCMKGWVYGNPVYCPRLHRFFGDPSAHFPVSPVPDPGLSIGRGKEEVWLPPLHRMGPERCGPGTPTPEVWEGGLVWGGWGCGSPPAMTQPAGRACLPPSTPEASWGVERGARARPLREGD